MGNYLIGNQGLVIEMRKLILANPPMNRNPGIDRKLITN
jgi:hypothetical protein